MIMSTRETSTGNFFMGDRINAFEVAPNPFTSDLEALNKKKEQEETVSMLKDLARQKQEEINAKLEKLELMPIGSNLIILPYPENPYKRVFEGGIIVDYAGQFLNPDTGEMDKQKEFIGCAKVIEAGPACKYVNKGDDVYYTPGASYPIPFMSLGYKMTNEPNILCVLNEGLTERFTKIK